MADIHFSDGGMLGFLILESWGLLLLYSKLFIVSGSRLNPILQDRQNANTPPSEKRSIANFDVDKIRSNLDFKKFFSMLLQIYLTSTFQFQI